MTNGDVLYAMKQAQIQRALGELKALNMFYYDMYSEDREDYYKMQAIISDFEDNLTDNFA